MNNLHDQLYTGDMNFARILMLMHHLIQLGEKDMRDRIILDVLDEVIK